MGSPYANLSPDPDDTMYVVEGEVNPPIKGDPEAVLVTIQPDPEHARKRFEVHFAAMNRVVTGEITVTPAKAQPEFGESTTR